MNNSIENPLYKLRSIQHVGSSKYKILMARGENVIETVGDVTQIETTETGAFDLLNFDSEEFNSLCIHGHVDSKILRDAIFFSTNALNRRIGMPTYF